MLKKKIDDLDIWVLVRRFINYLLFCGENLNLIGKKDFFFYCVKLSVYLIDKFIKWCGFI